MEEVAGRLRGPKPSHFFTSTSKRFRRLEKEKHAKSCEVERPRIREVRDGQTSNFASKQERFRFKQVFYGEDLKLTPGPGYYQGKSRQAKGWSNFSRAKKGRPLKQAKVGPGSYIKGHGSLVKKSFNMTLDGAWR